MSRAAAVEDIVTLSTKEICRYGQCTPESRNYEEGEKVINANHIMLIGKRPQTIINELDIYSLVVRTSGVNSGNGHVIEGSLDIRKKKELKVKKFICSCKAGSDKCKHIIAVLLHCNRNSINHLQEISSTDIKCLWNQKKGEVENMYKPTPVYDFCCCKPRVSLLKEGINYDEIITKMRNTFIQAAPLSALAKHVERIAEVKDSTDPFLGNTSYRNEKEEVIYSLAQVLCQENSLMTELAAVHVLDLKDCCRETYLTKIFLGMNEDPGELCTATFFDKTRWNMERQYRVTGSRCYGLYTASKNPKTEWSEKAKNYFWPKKRTPTDAMTHGIDTEKEAREAYIDKTKAEVAEVGLIVSEINPWLAYTPDGSRNGKWET